MRWLALALLVCGCQRADGGGPVGVPICDEFLQKAAACATRLGPSTVKGTELKGLAGMQRKNWAGSDPSTLPSLCKEALADVRRSYPDCAW